MKRGAILTLEQAELIGGKICHDDFWMFDFDTDGNYYISEDQILASQRIENNWVKNLPIVEFEPKNTN